MITFKIFCNRGINPSYSQTHFPNLHYDSIEMIGRKQVIRFFLFQSVFFCVAIYQQIVLPNSNISQILLSCRQLIINCPCIFIIKYVKLCPCMHISEVHDQKQTLRVIHMTIVCVFGFMYNFLTLSLNFCSQCNFSLYQLGIPDHTNINLLCWSSQNGKDMFAHLILAFTFASVSIAGKK